MSSQTVLLRTTLTRTIVLYLMVTSSEVTLVMFQRSVPNVADTLMALIAFMTNHISLFLTRMFFLFPGLSHKLPNDSDTDFLNQNMFSMERL